MLSNILKQKINYIKSKSWKNNEKGTKKKNIKKIKILGSNKNFRIKIKCTNKHQQG